MRQLAAVLAIMTLACLAACETFWPETYGEVTVGQPQVFSRERLLNERLNDIAWLDQQLARPFEQGMQGIRDFREASSLAIGLTLTVDQVKRRLAKIDAEESAGERSRVSEIADLEHKIEVTRLRKQLDALEKATEPSAPASGAAAPAADVTKLNEALIEINDKLAKIEEKLKPAAQKTNARDLFSGSQDRLISPAGAERSSASLTNRDQFEDEFAFRDAVHARMRERVLDDTHDLAGFTLYEMKFDAAITPGSNTRQKALIEIRIVPDTFKAADHVGERFIDRLRHRIEEDSNLLIARQHRRLAAGKLSSLWKDRVLGATGIDFASKCEGGPAKRGRDVAGVVKELSLARTRLNQSVAKGVPVDKDDAAAALLGRCLVTNYVMQRLELALGRYFDFELQWRDETVGAQAAVGDVPLLKVNNLVPFDRTKSALVSKLNDLQARMKPWVATVEPKEYAQNISDVASENRIRQLTLALSATSPGVTGGADVSSFKQQQQMLQAIRRQPLATSFSRGGDSFGWVLGPKFEIDDGKVVFVHSTARYTFGASVVVPGWFSSIKLAACGHWIGSDGGRSGTLFPFGYACNHEIEVNLPHSHRALLHALMDSHQDVFNAPEVYLLPQAQNPSGSVTLRAMPDACALTPDKSCEQTLVIEGRELWRNPSVFVGHQKANRVDLLPSMRGIVATFNALRLPVAAPGAGTRPQDLLVATSTGEDRLEGSVFILPPGVVAPKPFARPSLSYLDAAAPLEVAFVYPTTAFPRAYAEVSGRLRKAGTKPWITLPGEPQISLWRIAYKVDDPAALGMPAAPADLELDLAFRFTPGEDWVSMMQPGSRHVGYFKDPADREMAFAGVQDLSFAASEQFGDKQRQALREALRFTLPKDETMLLRAYPGLSDAMAQRGGSVRLALQRNEAEPPIAVTMERVVVKGKAQLQPALVSLANKDAAVVPRDEAVQTFVATLSYRRGGGEWIALPLDGPVELTITGRKKPPPPPAKKEEDKKE